MNGRVEREPLYLSDDSHLAELFREAEMERWRQWKDAAQITAAWLGVFAAGTVIWIGVLKAIGAW